ncbi:MAG: hypothetical protein U1E34_03710 [Amaricoccus sp.]
MTLGLETDRVGMRSSATFAPTDRLGADRTATEPNLFHPTPEARA